MKTHPKQTFSRFGIHSAILFCLIFSLLPTGCAEPPGNLFDNGGNIGNVKYPGAMVFDRNTNTYQLSGSGTNMWGNSDEFFMIWREVTGDFSLSARVNFQGEGVDPHRKMGLIIRKSLDADGVYADVALHGDGLTSLQYRDTKGNETQEVTSSNTAPEYIVLERKNNRIIMKTGEKEYPKEIDGEITLDLPEKCYVGIFICSHNPDVIESGLFTDVKFKQ